MKLYNSLTKQPEDFEPLVPGKASLYSCGPTVYNNLQIGNLSAFIYADLLRRALVSASYDVTAVMNITDVDDKTIRDSKRDYPDLEPMEALKKLTEKYKAVFKEDTERVGNDTNSLTFIRATETIPEMIQLTQRLLDAGFAYPADDGIYFSIKDYELAGFTYGRLQHINRAHEHARIANDEYDKDSASDFALWKKSEAGEPYWDATFTHESREITLPGRPGWHIECSAMSEKLLGVPFDIHTGGIDLKFPHHENEIAQTASATNQPLLARYFVHNNHILVDGKKMSKSLGNFYTLRDIEEKGFSPQAFRVLVMSGHYRNETNFSWDILEAAQNRLNDFRAMAALKWQSSDNVRDAMSFTLVDVPTELAAALQDDLNTPRALAYLSYVSQQIQQTLVHSKLLEHFERMLVGIDELLGLDLGQEPDITSEQKQLIREREAARDQKDWARSDELRDQLTAQGIGLRDTDAGTIWHRL